MADPANILVSCIMPTYNRRQFVPLAIKYFLRQDYEPKELIIVDDGTDAAGDLVPSRSNIRYIRLNQRMTLGAKRNLACEQAKGDVIVHWDDDDWMADRRVSYQLEHMVKEQADLCGLSTVLFYEPSSNEAWRYTYSGSSRFWVAGATLCYRKSFWKENRFPEISVGEDTRFVWGSRSQRMLALQDFSFYVAMVHSRNTSPKNRTGSYWSRWPEDINSILGEDMNFYRGRAEERGILKESTMKLNIGCCDAAIPDFVNVDAVAGPGVDTVADLRHVWPWPDDSVEQIRAWDIIEHLPDKIFTMNEMWRVLKPGGKAEIVVPSTDGSGAWQDPTHVSFWNRRSFLYYEAGNPYRERFARNYGIRAKFRVLRERTDHTQDGPRLTIWLEAVKP